MSHEAFICIRSGLYFLGVNGRLLTHLGLFLLFGPHTSAVTPPFCTLCTLLYFTLQYLSFKSEKLGIIAPKICVGAQLAYFSSLYTCEEYADYCCLFFCLKFCCRGKCKYCMLIRKNTTWNSSTNGKHGHFTNITRCK